MAKNPDLLIEKRRDEILEVFLSLYEKKSLGDINIKTLAEETRFTRATIYNYFKNIDEIFICAYQKEYLLWAEDLTQILTKNEKLTQEEFADKIAGSLVRRERMLRFSVADFHEREANCRREFVFSHKLAFTQAINRMHDCFAKFFPDKSEEDITKMLYIFFPFMHGMYRYVDLSDVQIEARQAADMPLKETSIYELAYNMIVQILK